MRALVKDDVAGAVLAALGGKSNVLSNTVCMTRLRVTLANPQAVDYERLNDVPAVLGTATRGMNGLEVVFGPQTVGAVYHAFVRLTGLQSSAEALFPMARPDSNLSVQVNVAKRMPEISVPAPLESSGISDVDLSLLEDLFGDDEDADDDGVEIVTHQLLVLNGPNVNLLGISGGPAQAGADFAALLELCRQTALEAGFDRCVCLQSNHEGDLIDEIQDAYCVYDAILINPAAYATSRAIAEALRIVGVPYQFVHLDLESTNHTGFPNYRQAIFDLAEAAHVREL